MVIINIKSRVMEGRIGGKHGFNWKDNIICLRKRYGFMGICFIMMICYSAMFYITSWHHLLKNISLDSKGSENGNTDLEKFLSYN